MPFGSPPTKADLKPSAFQWAGFSSGWTKGFTDKINSWTGRSRPLTGAGATDDVGSLGRPATPSNDQVRAYAQPNYGGTFVSSSSMVPISDWLAPHTEPINSTLVTSDDHAPSISAGDMAGGVSGLPSGRVFR